MPKKKSNAIYMYSRMQVYILHSTHPMGEMLLLVTPTINIDVQGITCGIK